MFAQPHDDKSQRDVVAPGSHCWRCLRPKSAAVPLRPSEEHGHASLQVSLRETRQGLRPALHQNGLGEGRPPGEPPVPPPPGHPLAFHPPIKEGDRSICRPCLRTLAASLTSQPCPAGRRTGPPRLCGPRKPLRAGPQDFPKTEPWAPCHTPNPLASTNGLDQQNQATHGAPELT